MAGDYSPLDRRDFLKMFGAVGTAAAFGYANNCYAQNPFDFRCTFRVNVFGKGWINDNPKEVAKLSPLVKEKLVFPSGKEIVQFSSIDFEPKKFVKFDIYLGSERRKPVASNVREDNYQRVLLPRASGVVNYSFVVTTPHLDARRFEQTFLFNNNDAILKIALKKPGVDKSYSLTSIDNFNGLYPRAFHLTLETGGVEYFVYGLESLVDRDVDPNYFASYFQSRDDFRDFSEFRRYQEKNLMPPLEVNPDVNHDKEKK